MDVELTSARRIVNHECVHGMSCVIESEVCLCIYEEGMGKARD